MNLQVWSVWVKERHRHFTPSHAASDIAQPHVFLHSSGFEVTPLGCSFVRGQIPLLSVPSTPAIIERVDYTYKVSTCMY